MSFTFENDLAGTITSVQENGEAAVDRSGTASVSFTACPMKEFLSAIEAKGIKSCGDIQITSGDLYLADGTSDKSLIKEVSLVFGTLDNLGDFTHVDPDLKGISNLGLDLESTNPGEFDEEGDVQIIESTTVAEEAAAASAKWYLRLVRPGGSIVMKPFEPLNNLMSAVAGSGNIKSLLDAMSELEELKQTANGILQANAYASKLDVDALELKADKDLVVLSDALDLFENRMNSHIIAGDSALISRWATAKGAFGNQQLANYEGRKMTAEAALSSSADCSTASEQRVAGGMRITIANEQAIKNMLIDVRILDKSADNTSEKDDYETHVVRNDIEVSWQAEKAVTDSGDTTIDVLYTAVDCGDSLDGLFVQFVAVDCAAQSLPGASYAAHEDQSYSSVFGAGNVLTTTDDADSDADKQRLVYSDPDSDTVDDEDTAEPAAEPACDPSATFCAVTWAESSEAFPGDQFGRSTLTFTFEDSSDAAAFLNESGNGEFAWAIVAQGSGYPSDAGAMPDPALYINNHDPSAPAPIRTGNVVQVGDYNMISDVLGIADGTKLEIHADQEAGSSPP